MIILGIIVITGIVVLTQRPAEPHRNDSATPSDSRTVTVYFIALEKPGTEEAIGCGDGIVGVTRTVRKTDDPLIASLSLLLGETAEPEGLYNSLKNSHLTVYRVQRTSDEVSVYLKGDLSLGGVCDSPRVEAQIERMIRQFEPKKTHKVYINDVPLSEALSQK